VEESSYRAELEALPTKEMFCACVAAPQGVSMSASGRPGAQAQSRGKTHTLQRCVHGGRRGSPKEGARTDRPRRRVRSAAPRGAAVPESADPDRHLDATRIAGRPAATGRKPHRRARGVPSARDTEGMGPESVELVRRVYLT
jgi:hypothetical protein